MKILLVDDDPDILELVRRKLNQDSYIVEVASNGELAIDLLQASTYGLVVLDVMLPRLNGVEVCQAIRNRGNKTPVLMLTGRNHITDKVAGLDAGADDYLVKPFQLDELTARVRALLRRNSEVSFTVLTYGPLTFDPRKKEVTYLDQPVKLRPKEMAILALMLRYPTQVFDTDSLLDRLWDLTECPGKATVKAHVGTLRKRMAAAGAKDLIETVYGQGYRINPAFLDGCRCDRPSVDLQPLPQYTVASQTSLHQDSLNQKILDETWAQVQTTSWNRVCQLEALVNSSPSDDSTVDAVDAKVRAIAPGSEAVTSEAVTSEAVTSEEITSEEITSNAVASNLVVTADPNECEMAMAIAHKLKGTLGSFGFQTASLQALHIESLLSVSAFEDSAARALLQDQVSILKQLMQPHITHFPESDMGSIDNADATEQTDVLVVAHDENWAQNLINHEQDLSVQIQVCSPLTVNEHLLDSVPAAIVIELSDEQRALDLSLLDALVSNYGEQIPILAALETSRPEDQLVAIYHGVSVTMDKTWSPKTLLTMIAEHAV